MPATIQIISLNTNSLRQLRTKRHYPLTACRIEQEQAERSKYVHCAMFERAG